MSPHAMTSLVSDLVEMAKAVELLPKVEAERDEAIRHGHELANLVQRLELKAHDRNQEIEALHAKVRELEVQRDDAELRFLEADDKINRLVNLVRGATVTLGEAVKEPEMPQPEPEAAPIPVEQSPYYPQAGQSEPDPMTQSVSNGPTEVVSSGQETVGNTEPNSGPYTNRRYIDVPGFVSRPDWLAGGGTEADYDWLPLPAVPF